MNLILTRTGRPFTNIDFKTTHCPLSSWIKNESQSKYLFYAHWNLAKHLKKDQKS